MKNSFLIPAASAVDGLSKTPGFPVLVAFKIAKLNVRLKQAVEPFEAARLQLAANFMDPMTGQPKLIPTKNPDGTDGQLSAQASIEGFNKGLQELMELDTPVTISEELKLSWDDISGNPNSLAPSRIENLYRHDLITGKPDVSKLPTKTVTDLSLGSVMDISTALFVLGNTALPLNSLLTLVLLENLSRIVPLGEAALAGKMPEDVKQLEMLALDVTQLEQLNPAPTGEVLTALMPLL